MDRVPRQAARTSRLRAGARERDIAIAAKNLPFVQARLAGGRGRDGEPDEPSLDRRESFLVFPSVHGRPLAAGFDKRPQSGPQLFGAGPPSVRFLLTFRRNRQRPVAVAHPGENRLQRVVLGLSNRIELMVVASRTAQGQAEERRARRPDHVIQFVLSLHLRQIDVGAFHDVVRTRHQITGGDGGSERIARQLFPQKLVVWLVVVERPDDIIAERPSVRPFAVGLVAVRVGKPNEIEPMAGPTLAIVRAGEHSFDQIRDGGGRSVLGELLDFVRRRRQPG